jgi:hypothetical protein
MSSETPSFKLWPVNSTLDCDNVSFCPMLYTQEAPYLLHIDARGAFENLIANQPLSCLTRPRKLYLHNSTVSYCPDISVQFASPPLPYQHTSGLQDLTGSLRAIRQRQGNNLIVSWEFNLFDHSISSFLPIPHLRIRTFSKMTKGPLTPPMVLYRILGVTLYDDDSRGSPMTAVL